MLNSYAYIIEFQYVSLFSSIVLTDALLICHVFRERERERARHPTSVSYWERLTQHQTTHTGNNWMWSLRRSLGLLVSPDDNPQCPGRFLNWCIESGCQQWILSGVIFVLLTYTYYRQVIYLYNLTSSPLESFKFEQNHAGVKYSTKLDDFGLHGQNSPWRSKGVNLSNWKMFEYLWYIYIYIYII